MRFPLTLTLTMAAYILRKKLTGVKRFPLVLMLEPLHACNLTCTGCGRIREYEDTIKEKLSVEECLQAVDEAGAPIVSLCGGEPMIYGVMADLVVFVHVLYVAYVVLGQVAILIAGTARRQWGRNPMAGWTHSSLSKASVVTGSGVSTRTRPCWMNAFATSFAATATQSET